MTLRDKYPEIFNFLVSCNGTGKLEVEKLISSGKIEPYEARLLYLQIRLEEMNGKLDGMNKKVDSL